MVIGFKICPLTRLQNFLEVDFMPFLSKLPTWSTAPDTEPSPQYMPAELMYLNAIV